MSMPGQSSGVHFGRGNPWLRFILLIESFLLPQGSLTLSAQDTGISILYRFHVPFVFDQCRQAGRDRTKGPKQWHFRKDLDFSCENTQESRWNWPNLTFSMEPLCPYSCKCFWMEVTLLWVDLVTRASSLLRPCHLQLVDPMVALGQSPVANLSSVVCWTLSYVKIVCNWSWLENTYSLQSHTIFIWYIFDEIYLCVIVSKIMDIIKLCLWLDPKL